MKAKTATKLNLKALFHQVALDIENEVDSQTDVALEAEGTADRLAKKFLIQELKLDKDTTHVSILERKPRKGELLAGKEPEKGAKIQIAHFRVHVSGSTASLKTVLDQSDLLEGGIKLRGAHIVYDHPSYEGPLDTSEARQKVVREAAKAQFDALEVLFESFGAQIKEFNEEIPVLVQKAIEKQRKRILARKEAERKLNPFV